MEHYFILLRGLESHLADQELNNFFAMNFFLFLKVSIVFKEPLYGGYISRGSFLWVELQDVFNFHSLFLFFLFVYYNIMYSTEVLHLCFNL